jgi:hypothetical protein
MNTNKTAWEAMRRIYRDMVTCGEHPHVAAIAAASEASASHGVTAGFALRHAAKLPECHAPVRSVMWGRFQVIDYGPEEILPPAEVE